MTKTLVQVSTLLSASAILLVGHGLQLTALPMRAESYGWSADAVGLTGSAFFAGFVAGCVVIPWVIARVAHIRSFMVMAAVATISLLSATLLDAFPAWLLLRFGVGFAISGLYMSIESWLASAAPAERRGGVLAAYSMISLAAIAVGQSMVGLADASDVRLLVVAATFVTVAIIPIGLTRMSTPPPVSAVRFSPRVLAQSSRVAMLASLFGGLVTGTFWALGPFAGRAFGLGDGDIGLMMASTIVGGALAQLPAGRLSDHTDRRYVIGGLFLLGIGSALLGLLMAGEARWALFVAMFGIGAAVMPVYPLCIATASDNAEIPLIQVASSILIMNGLGSIAGPAIASPVISLLGSVGFFAAIGGAMAAGAAWTFFRVAVKARPHVHDHTFQAVPKSSVVAAEMADETWIEEDEERLVAHDTPDAINLATRLAANHH